MTKYIACRTSTVCDAQKNCAAFIPKGDKSKKELTTIVPKLAESRKSFAEKLFPKDRVKEELLRR